MDVKTFEIFRKFWNDDLQFLKGVLLLEEFNLSDVIDQPLQCCSMITLILAIFVRKLRIHPVALHCLFVITFVFLFGLSCLLFTAVVPAPGTLVFALQLMMMFTLVRVRTIWGTTYLNYVTIYLCFRQLIFLIGSSKLSKLFRGAFLHFALIFMAFFSHGPELGITMQCFNFPIIASSQNSSSSYKSEIDPKTQVLQFYVLNTSTLILVLIVCLIRKIHEKTHRSSQVQTESQEEDQQNERPNSFWVFFWFTSLIPLKLLAALNMTLETFNLHPSLTFFSHFILCQPQILSQVAILLAAWFSGLSNSN